MNRSETNSKLIILGVVLLMLSGGLFAFASGTASAQEVTNETDDDEVVEGDESGPDFDETSVQVGDSVEVTGVIWDADGEIVLRMESDRPETALIVDSNSIGDSGSGSVTHVETTVSGETIVRIPAESESGSKTITISTRDDMIWMSNPDTPLITSISYTDLYLAGAGAGVAPIIAGSLYVFYRIRRLKRDWIDVIGEFSP